MSQLNPRISSSLGGGLVFQFALALALVFPVASADNQRSHFNLDTLIGAASWQDSCSAYRVFILARRVRDDGPVSPLTVPGPEKSFEFAFSLEDPCNSFTIDFSVGQITNFLFQLDGSLQSGRFVATNVPLKNATGGIIAADLDFAWTATGPTERSSYRYAGDAEGYHYSTIATLFSRPASFNGTISFKGALSPVQERVTIELPYGPLNEGRLGSFSQTWHRFSTARTR
jgi:hypothetical protein